MAHLAPAGHRILLLAHSFNSLTQRLFVELQARGHQVSLELDIADAVTEEAVALFQPDLVLAPFLKRRIPEAVWRQRLCLVVHPGPPGDRGPSALDWAVLRGERQWGVTVLQAVADYDAGPVWAWAGFELRLGASKGSLYRHEVTQAALQATLQALARYRPGVLQASGPAPACPPPGRWQPLLQRAQRAIDWQRHGSEAVLRRARSADGAPGVAATLCGQACRLFDLHPASAAVLADVARQRSGPDAPAPGQALARRGPALLVATTDGAVWVGQVRLEDAQGQARALKLPASQALATGALPTLDVPLQRPADEWDELRYSEFGAPLARVGWLEFDFHNGAMDERQCRRLAAALLAVRERDTQVLVLAGGADFFSNGIHLHQIEAAAQRAGDSAADTSWRNIQAMNDAVLALLDTQDRLTVAALRGNAGAGGCFLALAADQVWAHAGVVLNPHYRNMGNLHGSEYWTSTLPRRLGEAGARDLMRRRWPLTGRQAAEQGLIDTCLGADAAGFDALAREAALQLASAPDRDQRLAAKRRQRLADEAHKPLAAYRAEEEACVRRNFYGFDPSYHVARHHFVHRKPHAWTPRHLALHR